MKIMNKKSEIIEIALFGGGCFWGVQEIIRKIEGVFKTEVGYAGGDFPNPTYEDVKEGTTGHAEVLRVEFIPRLISYGALLDYFFRLHNPTQANAQGHDIGSQYRSVIFYFNEEQKNEAEKAKKRAEESGRWNEKIVTKIVEADKFWSAEEYHQDYIKKNPNGYTCHYLRK
jgi:methionine-S-sulfoxide reductase